MHFESDISSGRPELGLELIAYPCLFDEYIKSESYVFRTLSCIFIMVQCEIFHSWGHLTCICVDRVFFTPNREACDINNCQDRNHSKPAQVRGLYSSNKLNCFPPEYIWDEYPSTISILPYT